MKVLMRITIRQLFSILLFGALFLMTLRPVIDPDFWWHLRTGQLILATHTIPHTDPFSFTKFGSPWITHEWLSEILIAGIFRIGSYGLLIICFSLIIAASFFFVYLRCPAQTRPYIAGFALLLGAIATAPTWGVRPQMVSLLFTSLLLYFLFKYRSTERIFFLFPIPIITLVWVNMHAGFLLGLGIIAIFIFGILIELFLSSLFHINAFGIPPIRRIVTLCVLQGVCLLSTLINPNGIRILTYPFETLTSQAMQQFIQEWFSPDFHQLMWQPLALFYLALIGFGLIGKKSISPTNILLTLIFGYAALISARHVPLFIIVTIPVLAELAGSVLVINPAVKAQGKLMRIVAPTILLCTILAIGGRFIQVVNNQAATEADTFPAAAVNWIADNSPQGNIFNSYGWGGYLIWKLLPEYRTYIDGRADVYGDQFLYSFMNTYRAMPGWEETLDAENIGIVLVEPRSPLANSLLNSSAWHIAFQDRISVVYTRQSAAP